MQCCTNHITAFTHALEFNQVVVFVKPVLCAFFLDVLHVVFLNFLEFNIAVFFGKSSQCAIALDMPPFEYTSFAACFIVDRRVFHVNEVCAAMRTATDWSFACSGVHPGRAPCELRALRVCLGLGGVQ